MGGIEKEFLQGEKILVSSLAEKPHQFGALKELLENYFPKGAPVSSKNRLEDEFALLLNPANHKRILFIEDSQGKVAATAGYFPFDFSLLPRAPFLKTAGLGLFVTRPEYQRQGLGYKLEKEIEKRAQMEGIWIGVLWSELVQFYTKLGYMVAGSEWQWQLDRAETELLVSRLKAESPSENTEIKPLKDFSQVENLYKGFGRGPLRNSTQKQAFNSLLGLSNTYAYTAMDSQKGTLLGYGILGKGRDLRDTIHELVGYPQSIPPLLQKFATHIESGLRLHQPLGSPLLSEITHWLGNGSRQAMGFIKVLDGPKLADWISKSGYLPPGIGLVAEENRFRLLNRHTVFFESSDFGHLCQLFFGPWEISELEGLPPTFTPDQISTLPKPLPLYFWGFDSV